MFPFVFPPGYSFSTSVLSHNSSSAHTIAGQSSSLTTHSNSSLSQKRAATHKYVHRQVIFHYIDLLSANRPMNNSPQHHQQHRISMSHDDNKPRRPHIKKPLNAFMLFMKEQRAQVVQECTLRESAAINQILGRKV